MLNKDPVIREIEVALIVCAVAIIAVLSLMLVAFWPFGPHWSQWVIAVASSVVTFLCGAWLDAHGYHPEV